MHSAVENPSPLRGGPGRGFHSRWPQMHPASRSDIQRARRLRTEMTDAELRLWIQLRRRQMDGSAFAVKFQ